MYYVMILYIIKTYRKGTSLQIGRKLRKAKQYIREEEKMKDKIRKLKESISRAPHKKKAIIAILIALCMVGGAAGGYVYMTNTDFGKADVASQNDDKESAEEKEKVAEEELEKAKESGDKEAVKEAEKEVEKAKEKVKASNSNSSSNSSSHKSNSGTSNKGSYSKPSNSGSSSNSKPSKPSSGNSGSSGSGGSTTTQPSKPAHQHNWQPIYDYDYANSYERCKTCGANLSAMSDDEFAEHTRQHGSYELYYPTIIVGYQCYSCGATK